MCLHKRISRWLVSTIKLAYQIAKRPLPDGIILILLEPLLHLQLSFVEFPSRIFAKLPHGPRHPHSPPTTGWT